MFDGLSAATQDFANVVTGVGVLIALAAYLHDRHEALVERRASTFRDVDDSFTAMIAVQIENADLKTSIYEEQLSDEMVASILSDVEQRKRSFLVFDLVCSTLERTFLFFLTAPKELRHSQWDGWVAYTISQCENKLFQAWWKEDVEGYGYDRDFREFLDAIIALANEDGRSVGSNIGEITQEVRDMFLVRDPILNSLNPFGDIRRTEKKVGPRLSRLLETET